MNARVWCARTTSALSAAYLEHFTRRVLPELRLHQGFAGCSVLTRSAQDAVEIVIVSRWHLFAAIGRFAGKDHEAAVVAPEAAALLTDYDRRVRHFEMAITAARSIVRRARKAATGYRVDLSALCGSGFWKSKSAISSRTRPSVLSSRRQTVMASVRFPARGAFS